MDGSKQLSREPESLPLVAFRIRQEMQAVRKALDQRGGDKASRDHQRVYRIEIPAY